MKMPDRYTAARRLVQISVICAFCALPWLNAGGEGRFPVRGSLFALDLAGLPFADPVAALQALAQTAAGCLPGARLLLGACCSLALAFFMGRVFCSWICPYGFLSEMVRRLRPAKGPAKAANKDHARAFAVRSGLLAAGVIAAAAFGFPALELLSMPGELSLTPLAIWGEGTGLTALFVLLCLALPLAALAAEALAGRRLWCRFVCPQSVLLGLAAKLLPRRAPGLRIAWQARKCVCRGSAPCRDACPVGLSPRGPQGPGRRDCLMCGACVAACSERGQALVWRGKAAVHDSGPEKAVSQKAVRPDRSDDKN